MNNSQIQTKIMMDRAKSAVLARDYQLGARLYRGLLMSDPENIELLKSLGDLYEKSGKNKDSIPLYKEIVRIDPKNVDALNRLGAIYRRLNMYDESIAALEQAIILDETNVQTFYNLGFTYKYMEKYEDAVQCFNNVIEVNPNDVLTYNHLGTIYDLQHKYEKAVQTFQKGLKVDPNHPVLHLNLAKSYEHLELEQKAMQEYENALKYKPGWLDAIDGYADLLLRKNKSRDAGNLVQQALRLNPQSARMHTKLGNVYSKQHSFGNAQKEFNEALAKEPKDRDALTGLADAYEADGKNIEAIHVMKKLEDLFPDDSDVIKQFAHVLLTADRLNSASKKIKQVWDKNPEDVQTLNLLGQYYICRGDDAKAKGCYKRIESIDPHYKEYYKDGAKRYSQKGAFDKANEYCQQYMSENPDDPESLYTLAKNYERQNMGEEALKYYTKLAQTDSSDVEYKRGFEASKAVVEGQSQFMNTAESLIPESNGDAEIDDNIAPDFDFVEDDQNDSVIADDNIEPQLEEPLKFHHNDDFSFENLTQDDTDERNIFNKLDDEIQADKSADDELDDLEEDEEDDFFANNPFGSSSSASGPREDSLEPEFQAEDIDDSFNSEPESTFDVTDGLQEEPAEKPVEEPEWENAFDAPSSGNNSGNGGSGYSQKPSYEPETEFAEEDYAGNPMPQKEPVTAPDPSFGEEPVTEAESSFGEGDSLAGNESPYSTDESPVSPEPEFTDDESMAGDSMVPEEESLSRTDPVLPEEEAVTEADPSFGEEDSLAGNESPYSTDESPVSPEPEFTDDESMSGDLMVPEEESLSRTDPVLPEEEAVTGADSIFPEEESLVGDESLISEENSLTGSDSVLPEEESLSGPEPESSFDDEPVFTEEPSPSGEPVYEEETSFGSDENNTAEPLTEMEPDFEENSDSALSEDTSEPSFIEGDNSESDEITRLADEPEDEENTENSLEEISEEYPAESDDNYQVFDPAKEMFQSNQELFDRATSTLGDIVEALNDRQMAEKFTPAASLFIELKKLSDYLPAEKRNEFIKSKAHLQLEYIISKLTGNPGLLATAQALRDKLNLENDFEETRTGNELIAAVFTYMRSFTDYLPDQDIAGNLKNQIDETLERIKS